MPKVSRDVLEVEHEIGYLAFSYYSFVLFFKYWFCGDSALDADEDGDIDPEDVVAYIRRRRRLQSRCRGQSTSSAAGSTSGPLGTPVAGMSQVVVTATPVAATVGVAESIEEALKDTLGSTVRGVAEEDIMEKNLRRRLPWFTIYQCLVPFLFWLVFSVAVGATTGDPLGQLSGLDSLLPGMTRLQLHGKACEDLRFEAWRWLSYQFTHVGLVHVGMNCALNIMLGVPLEGVHGALRMFLVFNLGVLGGACFSFVSDPHAVVVGMSGGCYSLFGVHYADLVMNWGQKRFRKPILVVLTLLIGLDVVSYLLFHSESASYSAHVGGAVFGFLGGCLLVHNLVVKKNEQLLRLIAVGCGLGFFAFCLGWNFATWPPNSVYSQLSEGPSASWCSMHMLFNREYSDKWFCVKCADKSCVERWASEQHFRPAASPVTCADHECIKAGA